MLYNLTVAVNLILLGTTVWLGTYIVTRSPRSNIAWLAGLTLWFMAGPFLNILLALSQLHSPAYLPFWLRPLLWFWPPGVFAGGQAAWLQGWQVTVAYMTWHHATVLMRYGRMNVFRWVRVIAGYVVALVLILAQRHTSLIFVPINGQVLDISTFGLGPLHPFYVAALGLFGLFSLINLVNSARTAPTSVQRTQFVLMVGATLFAALAAFLGVVAYNLGFLLPRVVFTALLGIPIFLIGYAVARYSALTEGRVIGRDIAYSGVSILLVSGLYFLLVWTSVKAYGVPGAAMAVVIILAILTHSLFDIVRDLFDRLFYRRETRLLRERLRDLISRANTREALGESLELALETLCGLVDASYGLILLFKPDRVEQAAAFRWRHSSMDLRAADLLADDITRLPAAKLPPPLEDAALLTPLYAGEQQIGALVLGSPQRAISYSEPDIDRLLDAGDRIAEAIRETRRETANLTRLAQMAAAPPVRIDLRRELPEKSVEDALRNLFDYSYLADTNLANSPLVNGQLPGGQVTHLERGKAVYRVLLEGIERMRPGPDVARDPPPREWYPYLILHEAYLNGVSNRDIMLKLYISEGTFNRTRRSAIRSLARALTEMEPATA